MLVAVRRFDRLGGLHWLPVQRCELNTERGAYRVTLSRPADGRDQLPSWFWLRPDAVVTVQAA